jgi:hypothetical protein
MAAAHPAATTATETAASAPAASAATAAAAAETSLPGSTTLRIFFFSISQKLPMVQVDWSAELYAKRIKRMDPSYFLLQVKHIPS